MSVSHSYDSTLLQRMGFRDPDRKTPEHDRACIAIAMQPRLFLASFGFEDEKARASIEVPLQKGEGKYASTVGFIDAMLEWTTFRSGLSCSAYHPERVMQRCPRCEEQVYGLPSSMLVEVKTKIDSVGDLLRQMNLYREYKTHHHNIRVEHFVVWSLDERDAALSALLSGQGYRLAVGCSVETICLIENAG